MVEKLSNIYSQPSCDFPTPNTSLVLWKIKFDIFISITVIISVHQQENKRYPAVSVTVSVVVIIALATDMGRFRYAAICSNFLIEC